MAQQEQQRSEEQNQAFNLGKLTGATQQNQQINSILAQRLAQLSQNRNNGLGMSNQTVQEVQTVGRNKDQSKQIAAQKIAQQIELAKQQGAPLEYIEEMIDEIPDTLAPFVMQMYKK